MTELRVPKQKDRTAEQSGFHGDIALNREHQCSPFNEVAALGMRRHQSNSRQSSQTVQSAARTARSLRSPRTDRRKMGPTHRSMIPAACANRKTDTALLAASRETTAS